MPPSDEEELVRRSAVSHYEAGQPIWDPADKWNRHKRRQIDEFGRRFAETDLRSATSVLDAGCGSTPYRWVPSSSVALDLFPKQLHGRTQAVAADLCRLPFRYEAFDYVVCVASVLNYVPIAEALSEIARVLAPAGRLLLHFETSTSFEHLGRSYRGALAARVETENTGRADTIWVYHPNYVARILAGLGLRIVRRNCFHILSSLGIRLGLSQQSATAWTWLDRIAFGLGSFADDVILVAEKLDEGRALPGDMRTRS